MDYDCHKFFGAKEQTFTQQRSKLEGRMLYTDEERLIMSEAMQPNMRTANISIQPFRNIVADFHTKIDISGTTVLDIGPGQLDFLDLMKGEGATHTCAIDFDPAIQKLGTIRGHQVMVANLRNGWPLKGKTFDGIFCRGSLNCYWYSEEVSLQNFLDDIALSLNPKGWLWIAPWSKPASGQEKYVTTVERAIAEWSERFDIKIEEPDQKKQVRYGIGYQIPKVQIWSRF
jgi:hypothetical protein